MNLVEQIESTAGIKLTRIGIPQAEDIVKASATGMLSSLDEVNQEALHLFSDASKELLSRFNGDSEKAIATTLAYISGHYKKAL